MEFEPRRFGLPLRACGLGRGRQAGWPQIFLFGVAGEGLTQDRVAFQACLEADLRMILSVKKSAAILLIPREA